MTYDFYNKQPTQMIEFKMNVIIKNILHLIKALDRNISHSLIRNYSNINKKTE